jgi:hypothetical protein
LTTVASEITGIPLTFLVGPDSADLRIASIAQRMSWAANRQTKRVAIPLEILLNPGSESKFGLLMGRLALFNVDYPPMLLAREHKPAFTLSNKYRRFKFFAQSFDLPQLVSHAPNE